jgi:hypothetical protein
MSDADGTPSRRESGEVKDGVADEGVDEDVERDQQVASTSARLVERQKDNAADQRLEGGEGERGRSWKLEARGGGQNWPRARGGRGDDYVNDDNDDNSNECSINDDER